MIDGFFEVELRTVYGQTEEQRWEEPEKRKRKKINEEKVTDSQKEEDPGAEKVGKSRNTLFCQCFVAPEGRTVGLLKRWLRSHLAR